MDIITYLSNNLLWTAGISVLVIILLIALLTYFSKFFLYIAISLFVFSLFFFRNPNRVFAQENNPLAIACPADGKVVDISNSNLKEYSKKISIYLSPLDMHVNISPVSGKIEKINYTPGKFLVAFVSKSSDINEHNDVVIQSKHGKILVRQIAGFIARRICCWVKPNEEISRGQKFGMIRFGSRVDIFLPSNVSISLKQGQHVYAGETVLGYWLNNSNNY